MNRLMHALLAMTLAVPAWAAGDPSPPNVTTTSWEIYGAVAAVFVVGFAWVLWQQKKEKEREKRRERRSANPA